VAVVTDQKDPPWYDYLGAAERAEVRRLVAEVERLQGHMRALADTSVDRDTAGIFKGMWQGSERECEQLRAEIERLNGVVDSWVDINNAAGVTLRAQEAEIERLTEEQRAVLKHVEELRAEIERLNCALRRGEA
jgi:predicted RNase H-like nuclease (RuvC/YqgF family)